MVLSNDSAMALIKADFAQRTAADQKPAVTYLIELAQLLARSAGSMPAEIVAAEARAVLEQLGVPHRQGAQPSRDLGGRGQLREPQGPALLVAWTQSTQFHTLVDPADPAAALLRLHVTDVTPADGWNSGEATAAPTIAKGDIGGAFPALGQPETPAMIPLRHRLGKEFHHRAPRRLVSDGRLIEQIGGPLRAYASEVTSGQITGLWSIRPDPGRALRATELAPGTVTLTAAPQPAAQVLPLRPGMAGGQHDTEIPDAVVIEDPELDL
jgi:hypothetical protein